MIAGGVIDWNEEKEVEDVVKVFVIVKRIKELVNRF